MTWLILALSLLIASPNKHKPHDFQFKVHVEDNATGAYLEVSDIEQKAYLRSSIIPAEPGRNTYWVNFRDIPSGEMTATLTVTYHDGHQAQSTTGFFVP